MKILALETSAQTASAAIVAEGRILAEINITAGLTHSQTLIPAVNALFAPSKLTLRDMDLLAVSRGPGSFRAALFDQAALLNACHPEVMVSSLGR